jgi:N-glycosylase/DNA lyase
MNIKKAEHDYFQLLLSALDEKESSLAIVFKLASRGKQEEAKEALLSYFRKRESQQFCFKHKELLNRCRFWVSLEMVYQITRDEKYAKEIIF